MIEYFACANYAHKMTSKKEKENAKIKELFSNDENVTDYLTKKSINIDHKFLLTDYSSLGKKQLFF